MKYGTCRSAWNSLRITWLTAIHSAVSWPASTGIHQSAYLATWFRSGAITTNLAPSWRASEMKWTSGVRVMLRLEPIETMYLEWYQSALSATSVWSPQISGKALGRSAYQS